MNGIFYTTSDKAESAMHAVWVQITKLEDDLAKTVDSRLPGEGADRACGLASRINQLSDRYQELENNFATMLRIENAEKRKSAH